ncbi:MAG TPA: GGDEF domain-containing phosphodiesterase [Allosphingosinicella sp.]|jgi:diguanylate cyclase (GGDEF)-like protein|nr:GGDEF domain-containing phosphodiesterase [Allosphingosinicella sp.]
MGAPLFILSFRHRDELTRLAEGAGWQPIAARRAANAEARFVASGASVALVDARGALEEGQGAVRAIADAVEANAAALLVLVSRKDAAALDAFHQYGATHFLVSPFTEPQLLHALLFARRHADRAGGGGSRRPGEQSEADSWRWQPGSRTVELSPALARQAGLGEDEGRRISLMELFRKLDPDGRRAARSAIDRLMATGEATAFAHRGEAGGGRIAHHMRVEGEGGIVGRSETISGLGRLPAGRDPLTGLRDGRAARAWLAEQLGGGERPVILLVSVNRYDAINAAFGRATGDAVLQAAARRIERHSETDGRRRLVARMAGAEFAILLAAPATLEEGRFLAGELVEAIGRPFVSGDHVITLGAKAGVAAAQEGDAAAALLRRASAALAEARDVDSAPVRVIEEGAESATARGDRLEIDLRRALDQDEIEIRFQPQVSVTTGEITGAEALARWNHPQYGELGALTLFSVAEGSDYLVQLSDHVQRKAIGEAAAWPDALGALRLSVNITAADMLRPGFAASFLALVEESGFDPGRLTVEVTEGGLIEDLGAAAALLAALREGGLRVAIDDFGTGYSSLAYLKALPLDYLKIDKRLCQDIAGSMRDRIVVRSVIDMARSLGLDVVAEGVETEEQLSLLAQEGCTLYQGFLCAPPVGTEALVELMR